MKVSALHHPLLPQPLRLSQHQLHSRIWWVLILSRNPLDQQGKFYKPTKTSTTIRIDSNVLAWLQDFGKFNMRADRPSGRTPVLYEPSIVIVCQGHKRGYLADQVYRYDALHYLVH